VFHLNIFKNVTFPITRVNLYNFVCDPIAVKATENEHCVINNVQAVTFNFVRQISYEMRFLSFGIILINRILGLLFVPTSHYVDATVLRVIITGTILYG
jgi:hypothetical protein